MQVTQTNQHKHQLRGYHIHPKCKQARVSYILTCKAQIELDIENSMRSPYVLMPVTTLRHEIFFFLQRTSQKNRKLKSYLRFSLQRIPENGTYSRFAIIPAVRVEPLLPPHPTSITLHSNEEMSSHYHPGLPTPRKHTQPNLDSPRRQPNRETQT